MAIPTYEQAMIPVLRVLAADGQRHRRDIGTAVADALGLTDSERQQLLPSGKHRVILNRVGWALSYMKQARLVEAPKRGVYVITERGRRVLEEMPSGIDAEFLERFAEFRDFLSAAPTPVQSPEEALEIAYSRLRATLEADLLEAVKTASPAFFEELVVDLLVRMGYGGSRPEAARAVGRTGDGGIDGVIDEDRLGLDVIYVQAKRWENTVGRPDIQKFAGALQGQRARKGIFITTSAFSREAEEYAQRIDSRIVLIDGARLAALMFDFDVGVNARGAYTVKQLDSDYFEEG
jgi:restriction system protein